MKSRLALGAILFSTLLLLSAVPARADAASPLRKVTFITPQPTHVPSWVPIYAAEGLGFFGQEGMQLSFEMSRGTGDSAALLAAGKGEFGLTGLDSVMILGSKGSDVVSFFTYWQGDVNRLVVLEDSPFKEMTDLKGKDIGVPFLAGTTHYSLLNELSLWGMKEDDVKVIAVGVGPASIETLLQRKISASFTASYGSVMYLSETRGIKVRVIPVKAKPIPTMVLATSKKMIISDRNTVVGFARAIAKGIVYCMANGSAAIDVMQKVHPETVADRAYVETNTKFLTAHHITEEGKRNLIGWHDPEAWVSAQALYEKVGIIPSGVVSTNSYTNELLKEINSFDRSAIERLALSRSVESSQGVFWDPRLVALLALTLLMSIIAIAFVIRRFSRSRTMS